MKIVAVTACPTGIAHTYMAAEQLEKTAKKLGHTIKVETQGAMGIENELSQADDRRRRRRHHRRRHRARAAGALRPHPEGGGARCSRSIKDPRAVFGKL